MADPATLAATATTVLAPFLAAGRSKHPRRSARTWPKVR